jgi:hypothetical protein
MGISPMRRSVAPWGTSSTIMGSPHFTPGPHAGDAGGVPAEFDTMPQPGTERTCAEMLVGQLLWLNGAAPAM